MKLRKKVQCHPGDKRHLAEDQGQANPWGSSTHRETRKSGISGILLSSTPERWKGGHLTAPVCETEAAKIKPSLGGGAHQRQLGVGGRVWSETSRCQESDAAVKGQR